ncbi:hypothetical protein GGR28_002983 [Lewinella aquimaris]|uniref:DUF4296 domain-containing protein n=1 Tax=Neolewinella aquimaris TaxID=1835722 RepID=A0A840EEX5_9BACT|nr:hypothetical protein [Neolewinella aquimaris]MBB4080349.1 hypothetical protein [Neolewinella aquimaris]
MRKAVTCCLLLLALGCADVTPARPPVDTERLVRTVADLHLAQALTGEVPIVIRDSIEALYFDSVLADHGYTRREFDSLMWIIRQEPIWIDSIYTKAGEIVAREMIDPLSLSSPQ